MIAIVYQMLNQQKTVERPVPAGHTSCGGCACASLLWVRCQRCLFELPARFLRRMQTTAMPPMIIRTAAIPPPTMIGMLSWAKKMSFSIGL